MARITFYRSADMQHFDLLWMAGTPNGRWTGITGTYPTQLDYGHMVGGATDAETRVLPSMLGENVTLDQTGTKPIEADISDVTFVDLDGGADFSMGRMSFKLSDFVAMSTSGVADDMAFIARALKGDDVVTGSASSDILNGFAGSDYLTGGAADGIFLFSSKLVEGSYD